MLDWSDDFNGSLAVELPGIRLELRLTFNSKCDMRCGTGVSHDEITLSQIRGPKRSWTHQGQGLESRFIQPDAKSTSVGSAEGVETIFGVFARGVCKPLYGPGLSRWYRERDRGDLCR